MLPAIYVPVGGRLVRIERTIRPAHRYDGWAMALAASAGFCGGILALVVLS